MQAYNIAMHAVTIAVYAVSGTLAHADLRQFLIVAPAADPVLVRRAPLHAVHRQGFHPGRACRLARLRIRARLRVASRADDVTGRSESACADWRPSPIGAANGRKGATMNVDEALRQFAEEEKFPRAAMTWALENWEAAAPRFVSRLRAFAAGGDRSISAKDEAFCIVHLCGEKGEPRAYETDMPPDRRRP